jgi:calcineurin-like phosphoesterase family protein
MGQSVEEMNELLIQQHNSVVKKGDTVYFTGDFSFGNKEQTEEILKQLNGEIHIVLGNHDTILRKNYDLRKYFASTSDYKRVHIGEDKIMLMHFPIEDWDMKDRGSMHLHGHLHGSGTNILKNRMDIGIDTRKECDMKPYAWEEIKQLLGEK